MKISGRRGIIKALQQSKIWSWWVLCLYLLKSKNDVCFDSKLKYCKNCNMKLPWIECSQTGFALSKCWFRTHLLLKQSFINLWKNFWQWGCSDTGTGYLEQSWILQSWRWLEPDWTQCPGKTNVTLLLAVLWAQG